MSSNDTSYFMQGLRYRTKWNTKNNRNPLEYETLEERVMYYGFKLTMFMGTVYQERAEDELIEAMKALLRSKE